MPTYADVPGSGSTNYDGRSAYTGTTQGITRSGTDNNDVNYYNRTYYGSPKAYTDLYRYQFCFSMIDKAYTLPTNTVNNSTAKTKSLTTESFDPFGDIFFYNSTSVVNAGVRIGSGTLYRQYLADLRYAFNTGGYDAAGGGILVAGKPVYISAVPQSDGSAKLSSIPIVQNLPSEEDGKIYIFLGICYPDEYPYRVALEPLHPIYWYKNNSIRQFFGVNSDYILPIASSSVLGGVMVGDNLSIDNDGVLSASSRVLKVALNNIQSLPCIIQNADVKSNMIVINSYLSDPGAQLDDWTVTTGSGTISISGTMRGTTSMILTLIET